MIDQFLNMFDITCMLTIENASKRPATATPAGPARVSSADLEFASANQQLEGFPGIITEEIAAHVPNMSEIAESARRMGAQIPSEENRLRPPLFPRPKP